MIQLSQEFVDRCPEESGYRLRGLEMTRTEVFVDAAFAFAVTILVISFDAIPGNWEEVVVAIKTIPAFGAAVAMLVWLWWEHAAWSKRFGLDDAMAAFLSALLLVVMLVYIYPLRMMAGGMFTWLSNGYLPATFELGAWSELAGMFTFLGLCFAALCIVFMLMNRYALKCRDKLLLSESEAALTRAAAVMWAGSSVIGLISAAAAHLLPDPWIPFAGFAYALLGVWMPYAGRARPRPNPND